MSSYNFLKFVKLLEIVKGNEPGQCKVSIELECKAELAEASKRCIENEVSFKVVGNKIIMIGGW